MPPRRLRPVGRPSPPGVDGRGVGLPRLRAVEATDDGIVFRFVDVTNRSPGQSMLVERTLRFVDDVFEDTETSRAPERGRGSLLGHSEVRRTI